MSDTKKRISQARNKVPDMPDVPPPPPAQVRTGTTPGNPSFTFTYVACGDVPPFDRYHRIIDAMHLLHLNGIAPQELLGDMDKMVEQYEAMIGSKRSLTGHTVEDDLAFNRNRVGPVDEGKPASIQRRENAEASAREMLKEADRLLTQAIRAYEQAAPAMMGVDFNRGLTVATWAKALRVKVTEMKLEGA